MRAVLLILVVVGFFAGNPLLTWAGGPVALMVSIVINVAMLLLIALIAIGQAQSE